MTSICEAFLAGVPGTVKAGYSGAPRIPEKPAAGRRGGAVIRYEVQRVSAVRGIWTETREKRRPGR